MEMESFEKSLKTSFVGAANQITQLYTNSLNYQKQAYVHGYNQANRDTLEFILKHNSYLSTGTIPIEELLEYLKSKLEANGAPFSGGQTPKVQTNPAPPVEPRPTPAFFKFDNGFAPSPNAQDRPMEMPSMNGGVGSGGFHFGVPSGHQQGINMESRPNVGFGFLPPESVMPQQQQHTLSQQDPSSVFNYNPHTQDMGFKRRHFETPSSMEFSDPTDHFHKKSRVTG